MKRPAIEIPEVLTCCLSHGQPEESACKREARVLLHACCAPCSSAIVEWMVNHGLQPHIYYYNPNIFPLEEYNIRKQESKRHAERLGLSWTDGDYNHDQWYRRVCQNQETTEHQMENEPERGRRCQQCFNMRLLAAAQKAKELGITVFATTLASSRWKSIEQINRAGIEAQNQVPGTLFWAQNWRKGGLYERRNQLLKEYHFYNQQYCGCEYSMRTTAGKENLQGTEAKTTNNEQHCPL